MRFVEVVELVTVRCDHPEHDETPVTATHTDVDLTPGVKRDLCGPHFHAWRAWEKLLGADLERMRRTAQPPDTAPASVSVTGTDRSASDNSAQQPEPVRTAAPNRRDGAFADYEPYSEYREAEPGKQRTWRADRDAVMCMSCRSHPKMIYESHSVHMIRKHPGVSREDVVFVWAHNPTELVTFTRRKRETWVEDHRAVACLLCSNEPKLRFRSKTPHMQITHPDIPVKEGRWRAVSTAERDAARALQAGPTPPASASPAPAAPMAEAVRAPVAAPLPAPTAASPKAAPTPSPLDVAGKVKAKERRQADPRRATVYCGLPSCGKEGQEIPWRQRRAHAATHGVAVTAIDWLPGNDWPKTPPTCTVCEAPFPTPESLREHLDWYLTHPTEIHKRGGVQAVTIGRDPLFDRLTGTLDAERTAALRRGAPAPTGVEPKVFVGADGTAPF